MKNLIILILFFASFQIFAQSESAKPLITFIELGSDKCIPCKQMQPILKSVEKKYGDQIRIIFYDVWKSDQKKYAGEYKIRLIPTQVFLDADGKEFFRHEGFYPEEEIDKLLQSKGLTIKTTKKTKSDV
jgi:thioredoxin 1